MPIPPTIAAVPPDQQNILLTVVKPKFDAYFSITSGGGTAPRSVSQPQGFYICPNATMISDTVYLWAVFSDVYEILGGASNLAEIVKGDPDLKCDISRIIEGASTSDPDGSFWHFPRGQVPLHEAVEAELKHVLKTLRNGFAHSHWLYENLSALEYWIKRGWQTANAPPAFDLQNRPMKNYMTYIADAKRPWDPQHFWGMKDLRILVTPSHVLRYHLHVFLNYVLNGSRKNIFEQ